MYWGNRSARIIKLFNLEWDRFSDNGKISPYEMSDVKRKAIFELACERIRKWVNKFHNHYGDMRTQRCFGIPICKQCNVFDGIDHTQF